MKTSKLNFAETALRIAQELVEVLNDGTQTELIQVATRLERAMADLGEFELNEVNVNLERTFGDYKGGA